MGKLSKEEHPWAFIVCYLCNNTIQSYRPEEEDTFFLPNVHIHLADYTLSQPIRPQYEVSATWNPQIRDEERLSKKVRYENVPGGW